MFEAVEDFGGEGAFVLGGGGFEGFFEGFGHADVDLDGGVAGLGTVLTGWHGVWRLR